ncbi:MAG: peptidoglycan-binding protein [Myxococcota bacterium]
MSSNVKSTGTTRSAPKAAPRPSEAPQAPKAGSTYTVRKGDTLWDISRKAYGDGNRWREIADANKAKVGAKGLIQPGERLRIPQDRGADQFSTRAPSAGRATTGGSRRGQSALPVAERTELKGDVSRRMHAVNTASTAAPRQSGRALREETPTRRASPTTTPTAPGGGTAVARPQARTTRVDGPAPAGTTPPPSDGTTTPTEPQTPPGLGVGARGKLVERAEQRLKRAGFSPGKVDKTFTTKTEEAVRRFQESTGLEATGRLDDRTLRRLQGVDRRIRRHGGALVGPGQNSGRIHDVEKRLRRLGYAPGKVDGVYDHETAAAVRAFRKDQGIKSESNLMGKRAQEQLRHEVSRFQHEPFHSRVKASRERRRMDDRVERAAATEHADGTQGLGRGSSRSAAVKYVQGHLKAAGYDPKRTDGVFDERTEGALKEYQRREGLPTSGRVDSRTWKHLRKATLEARDGTSPPQTVGERSRAVLKTERMLKKLGYKTGDVDGRYTEATQRAVDRFRRRKRLGNVGKGVGSGTVKALQKAIRQKNNPFGKPVTMTGYRNGVPYPVKVVKVDGYYTGVATAKAYKRMEAAARRDGIDLDIVSGFRTMAKQRELYNLYGPSRAAYPGYSNHQNGSALDLNVQTAPGNMAVGVGSVYNWLARNAHRFGFSRIASEAWHWEYRR